MDYTTFKKIAWSAALTAALASLAACGGGGGGSDASSATTGQVVSSIVGGPFVATVGNSIQVQGSGFAEQSNIAVIGGMTWSATATTDATAPGLILGNAGCGVATKNDVKYPAGSGRATGTSTWGCAVALAAAPSLTKTTDYTLSLTTVDDRAVSHTASTKVTYVVIPGSAPITPAIPSIAADAGLGFSLLPGATGTLHCAASGGTPGATGYTYQWLVTANAGYNVVLSAYDKADVTFTAPAVTSPTTLTFRCTAFDSLKAATTSTVAVTVTPAAGTTNSLVASAGNSTATAVPGQTVPLDGSATGWFDAKGAPAPGPTISYQWSTTYPGVTIQNAAAAKTSFVVPTSITTAKRIPFTLTATSGGATSVANAQFLVDPYGPFSLTVSPPAQAVATGTAVTITAKGSSSSGSPTLYYQWFQTSGPTVTLGGATTSTIGFVPSLATTYNFQVNVGYEPITSAYPGVYTATATVTASAPPPGP